MKNVFKKHGEAGKDKTKEYRSWAGIMTRCTNKKHKRYSEWGGRGITVCERWHTYENFLADMGRAPSPSHSIDRMENDKGYYKENCRWATQKEQSNNTRRNVLIKYKGSEKTLSEWCELLDMEYKLIALRIWKGWSVERAFTEGRSVEVSKVAVLGSDEVRIIREALNSGFKGRDISSYFKVSPMTISRIKHKEFYKNVT